MNMAPDQTLTKQSRKHHKTRRVTRYQVISFETDGLRTSLSLSSWSTYWSFYTSFVTKMNWEGQLNDVKTCPDLPQTESDWNFVHLITCVDFTEAHMWKTSAFYLRRVNDFSQRPHQRSVDPHQLLSADLVCLVQHHAHFVLMVLQSSDHLGELVRDIELVGVEQEDDAVHALCEPLQHSGEIVTWREKSRWAD